MDVKVEDDREAQACYLRVSQPQIARTVHVEDGVMVDVDHAEKPVGVEFLWERYGVPAEALTEVFLRFPSLPLRLLREALYGA